MRTYINIYAICQYPCTGCPIVHLSSSLSSGWRGLVGGSSSSSLVTAARLSFGRHQPNSYHLNLNPIIFIAQRCILSNPAVLSVKRLGWVSWRGRSGLVGGWVGWLKQASVHCCGSTMTLPPVFPTKGSHHVRKTVKKVDNVRFGRTPPLNG